MHARGWECESAVPIKQQASDVVTVGVRQEHSCDGLPGDVLGLKIGYQLATDAKVIDDAVACVKDDPLGLCLQVQDVVA